MIVRLFFYLQWVLLVASCVSTLSSAAFLGPSSSKSTGRCSMLAALASSPPVRPNENTGPIGLYVHIPYCRRRCRYCDFAIVPIGPNAATEGAVDNDDAASQGFLAMNRNYTAALLKEIGMIQSSEKVQLRSVYFGGGTPSLAPLETLQEILDAIRSSDGPFVLQKDAEISIEMDPGTFSKDKLRAVKDMGFNRISLGVQSFDDRILESLGRVHKSQDVWESLTMLQDVYGDDLNYSLDLISGLPGLSLAKWTDTLHTALNLQPQPSHLSVYDLQIESGTVFGSWYDSEKETSMQQTRGELPVAGAFLTLPSEEDAAFMYKYAAGYLRSKGYEHYEVSSYALMKEPGVQSPTRSQHNQIYWATDSQWYALGLGATSFVHGILKARPRTLVDYVHWVEEDMSSESSNTVVGDFDLLTDVVLKRLRTSEGLSLDWVAGRFDKGDLYVAAILRGAQLGRDLGMVELKDDTLRLVDPTGFIFSNTIISTIFVELEVAEAEGAKPTVDAASLD